MYCVDVIELLCTSISVFCVAARLRAIKRSGDTATATVDSGAFWYADVAE